MPNALLHSFCINLHLNPLTGAENGFMDWDCVRTSSCTEWNLRQQKELQGSRGILLFHYMLKVAGYLFTNGLKKMLQANTLARTVH